MYYYYNGDWMQSAVRGLLKEKAEAFLDQAAGKTVQTSEELWDSLQNCSWNAEVAVERDKDRITIRFDGMPEEDRIEVSNTKYYYDNRTYVELEVFWREYSCHISSEERISLQGCKLLIDQYPAIAASMEKRLPTFQRKQKERDDKRAKQEKAWEIRVNAVRSWLSVFCKQLDVPYRVEEKSSRFDLYLLMPDETQAQFQIPVNHFEDSVSEIPALIEQLMNLYHKKTKLLVLNYIANRRIRWMQND